MNWKLKCLALHALAHMPYGLEAHSWLQRTVTGRYLEEVPQDVLAVYNYHVKNFLRLPSPRQATALEFGAGRSLLTALLLSAAGAREVFAYDIVRLASAEPINHVIRQLRAQGVPHPGPGWREIENVDADLRRYYRINYCAPGDARATGLPPSSIDFVCSTSTLEHIDRGDIVSILEECRRICSPSALMSFIVDYHDHYATADPAITRFNFYRYTSSSWAWFNPPNHFQNRLRHSDYESLFRDCGSIALENRPIVPPASERQLGGARIAADFGRYSQQDLVALNGFFLLRARSEPTFEPDKSTFEG